MKDKISTSHTKKLSFEDKMSLLKLVEEVKKSR